MTDCETFDKAMLLHELAGPATAIKGLAGLKTRYRPLVCPLGLVLEKIDPGAKVYDVGCGTGALLYLAIRLRHAQLAHGGDVSKDVVHASNAFARYFTEFHVSRLEADLTPLDLAGYDTVTMIDVLHHIRPSDQVTFLGRLIAAMPAGAKLIILDIDASKPIGAWCNQVHDLLLAREWVHPMWPDQVVATLSAAGAQVVEPLIRRRTFWYPHFRILARKPPVERNSPE